MNNLFDIGLGIGINLGAMVSSVITIGFCVAMWYGIRNERNRIMRFFPLLKGKMCNSCFDDMKVAVGGVEKKRVR